MATTHEIRSLIEKTTKGTHRRRVPEEVKEQVRRYAARRRTQGSSWEAIGRETGLEARKLRAWCWKVREVTPVPTLRPVAVVADAIRQGGGMLPRPSTAIAGSMNRWPSPASVAKVYFSEFC
jgi:hypothetical protein